MSEEGTQPIVMGDVWPGNGKVVITIVAPIFAGTPGQANCHGKSASALAQHFGGMDAAAAALHYPSVQALQDAINGYCAATS
jgi:hypothetical protein